MLLSILLVFQELLLVQCQEAVIHFQKLIVIPTLVFGNSSDTLTATVTDTAGNSVTEDITISISKVDNQPPTIGGLTSNKTNNGIELRQTTEAEIVTFTVSVSDNENCKVSVALSQLLLYLVQMLEHSLRLMIMTTTQFWRYNR